MSSHENPSFNLSPKISFALGLIGGILILCTIGFFILLGLILDDKTGLNNRGNANPTQITQPDTQNPTVPSNENAVGDIKPIGEEDHVIGSSKAKVTLIVYTDFECPFCSRFHPTFKQALEEFDGQIQAAIRHFPLSFHTKARSAANAAECAGEQGKFFEYADALFENQTSLGDDLYNQTAKDLKLNLDKFSNCLKENKYDEKINADMSSGIAANVQGTPGTIILSANGEPQLVPGAVPYEQLKAMIEAALK
jgi:protein-disulfide isomerase